MKKKQITKPELRLIPAVFILMILITISFVLVDNGAIKITGMATQTPDPIPIPTPPEDIVVAYSDADLGNVTDLTITTATAVDLVFADSINMTGINESNILSGIEIGASYFYLDPIALSQLQNKRATLTFYYNANLYPNIDFVALPLPTVDGEFCADCTNIRNINGNLVYDITHFSNYSYTPTTALNISDTSDSSTVQQGENLTFYAYYTNVSNNSPIEGAICSLSVESQFETPANYNMDYITDHYEYEIATTSVNLGNYDFTIQCSHDNFDTITLTDDYTVVEGPLSLSCGDSVTESGFLGTDLTCSGDALTISTDDITLNCDGHKIIATGGTAITLHDVDNVDIKNCVIEDSDEGVVIAGATNSKIYNNNLTNITNTAIGSVYALASNSGNDIYDNKISISNKGIELDCSGTSYKIYDNFFESIVSSSISALTSDLEACSVIDNLKIYDNEISGVDVSTYNFGIYLDGVRNSEIYNNTIYDSVSSDPAEKTSAILVTNSKGLTNIYENTLVDFDYGVTVYQSDYPVEVYDNSFSSSYIGSVLIHTASNVDIFGNSFYNTDYHIETNTAFNITIENNTFDVAEYNFIYSYLTNNLKINNNTFNSNSGNTDTIMGYDIYLDDDITNLEIYSNDFNPKVGAILHANSGFGDFNNILIHNNNIISGGALTAINLTTGGTAISPADNSIKENEISGFTNAIKIKNINNILIEDNYVESNTNGLILDNADNTQFIENWFCTNTNDVDVGTSTGLFGDNNSCENPGIWNDDSSLSGCKYQCAICGMTVNKGILMGENLSCTADGFHITVDDAVIDCNGYSIIGDGGTGGWADPDFGISPTFGVGTHNNLEVKNCNIHNFDLGIGYSGDNTNGLWVHDNNFVDNTLAGINLGDGINSIFENNYFSGQLSDDIGITLISNANNSLIKGNEFESLTYSILTDGVGNEEIYNNSFDSTGIPVYLYNSSNNKIYDNTGINSYMGVLIEELSENNIVRDNSFTGLDIYPDAIGLTYKQGVKINNSDNNTIYDNVLIDFDDHAIQIINSVDINITNNTLESTMGNGIYLDNSDNCILNENTLKQNGKGIRTLMSNNLILNNNYFYDNNGQSFYIDTGNNLHFENNLLENTGGGYGLWDVTNSNVTGDIINGTNPYPGFALYRSHGNRFEDIYQRDAQQASTNGQDGIYVQSSQNNTFVNVTSVENGHHSLIFSVEAGTGLNTKRNEFVDCNFSNNGLRGVVFALVNSAGTENVINNSIINSTISNNGDYGIQYYANDEGGYTETKLIGNTIESNGLEGVNLMGSNLEIKNNIIRDNGGDYGLYITSANYSTIDGNEIIGSVVGIGVDKKTAETNITNNILINNTYGLAIQGTFDESSPGEDISNLRIFNNNIYSQDYGIILQYGQLIKIKNNEIHGSEYGISLDNVDYGDIDYNNIYDVDYGLDVYLDYSNISENNVTSRLKDIVLTSSTYNKIFNNIDAPYEEIIGENNYGLVLISSSNNEIYNNNLNDHKGGDALPSPGYVGDYYGGDSYALYLENSHSNIIYSNQINNNTGGEGETEPGVGYGVYLNLSNSNYLYDNELQYNEYAIYVKSGVANSFEDNFMRFNDYAMRVDNSQLGNIIGNIICRNTNYDLYVVSSSASSITNNYCDNSSVWNETSFSCDNRIFNASRNAIFPIGMELNPDTPNLAIANYDFEFDILVDGTGWTDYSIQISNNFTDFENITSESSTFDETTGDTTYHFVVSDEDADYKVIRIRAENPCYNETHVYGKYKLELKKTGTGINLITLPVETDRIEINGEKEETATLSTIEAEEFGQRYTASSGYPWLDYISEWLPSLQQYRGHPVGFESVSPLTMEPGKPYFVSVREPINITLYGWIPNKREFDVTHFPAYEKTSYNFITLPLDTELKTGYDLCLDLIEKGISDGNTYIYIWDEVSQNYIKVIEPKCSEIISNYGTPFGENFDLIPGKTYRFTASSEGTWLQK